MLEDQKTVWPKTRRLEIWKIKPEVCKTLSPENKKTRKLENGNTGKLKNQTGLVPGLALINYFKWPGTFTIKLIPALINYCNKLECLWLMLTIKLLQCSVYLSRKSMAWKSYQLSVLFDVYDTTLPGPNTLTDIYFLSLNNWH